MTQNKSTYISTATTTPLKTGSGRLKRIILTETAAGTITIFDNTAGSGTIIGLLKASIAEQEFEFDVNYYVGLTIVTAAASKLTVVYE
jgi:short-subunit dehydrogenase